jgi:hypothetical protein
MATILRTNGTTEEDTPANKKKGFELAYLQGIVGGPIEIVYLTAKEIMVVNEEGKLLELPVNHEATMRFAASGRADIIVGDALVCKGSEIK